MRPYLSVDGSYGYVGRKLEDLDDAGHDFWRATVALNDGTGRQLGPSVVLPVAGEIADYIADTLGIPARVRATPEEAAQKLQQMMQQQQAMQMAQMAGASGGVGKAVAEGAIQGGGQPPQQ